MDQQECGSNVAMAVVLAVDVAATIVLAVFCSRVATVVVVVVDTEMG